MERYLRSHNVSFEREPVLSQTPRRLDFAVTSAEGTQVLIEVKTIWNPPPQHHGGATYFDPYGPVRSHISAAMPQFSKLPDTINVIALAVFPGSFADISSLHVMIGAMDGDIAFSFPFNTSTGQGDASKGSWNFVPGKGQMVRKQGDGIMARNTRIAALLSLHQRAPFWLNIPDGATLSMAEYAKQAITHTQQAVAEPYVTLWPNGWAKQSLPSDLFRGDQDAHYGIQDGYRQLTYKGPKRYFEP